MNALVFKRCKVEQEHSRTALVVEFTNKNVETSLNSNVFGFGVYLNLTKF